MILSVMFFIFLLSCSNDEIKKFAIDYDLDGGISNNLVSIFYEDEVIELSIPIKEGYRFLGWYEDNNLVEVINENKDYHLIAKWELINIYNIDYNLDGGTCDDLILSFNEDEFISLPIPNRIDYRFIGWYEDNNLVEEINENKDYHLTAKWEKLNLLLLYNDNVLNKLSLHEIYTINLNNENVAYNFNDVNNIQGGCITNNNYSNLDDSFVYQYYFEATYITNDFSNNELTYVDLNYTYNVSLQLQSFGHFNEYLKNNGVIDQDNKINFEIDGDSFLKIIKEDFFINDTATFKQHELEVNNLNVITILFNSTKFKEILENALKEKVILYTNVEESLYNLYQNNLDELPKHLYNLSGKCVAYTYKNYLYDYDTNNDCYEKARVIKGKFQNCVINIVDNGVEVFLKERQHLAFATTILVGSNHINVRIFVENLHHIPNDFRPLLQVGIDQRDIFTTGVV